MLTKKLKPGRAGKSKSIFAKRLSETRRKKGWDQWAFSEILGVHHSTLVFWENDRRKPQVDMLVEITKLLGVSADWLLGIEEASVENGGVVNEGE